MRAILYKRKKELYNGWAKLYNANRYNMSFDEQMKIIEIENDLYNRWLFYDKLLKRLEVVNRGEQKKKCNKEKNCTYKRSKTTKTI